MSKNKITVRFFLYILGGGFLGACLSIGAAVLGTSLVRLLSDFYMALLVCSPWIFISFCLATLFLTCVWLNRAKKMIAHREGLKEEAEDAFYRKTERLLGFSLGAANLGTIVLFMTFALITIAALKKSIHVYLFFLCTLCSLFTIIFLSFLQRKAIEQLRILNPEKRGDALELHFRKKWLESSDEQERLAIYAASYKAFSSLSILFFVFYILLILMVPFFHISFLPFLCVGLMWLIPNVFYFWEAAKETSRQ